jgi:signal transduction histidine kinase
MIGSIRKMSLRTRLAVIAGFAVLSLLVAILVAWRLARTTEAFAVREADSATHSAARDLARELSAHPDGYTAIELAEPLRHGGKHDGPPAPPHVTEAFKTYSDPVTRLTAVTIHRYDDVDGGFYNPTEAKLSGATITASSLLELVKSVATEAGNAGAPASKSTQFGNDRIFVATYPVNDNTSMIAWAIKRLPRSSGVSDWPNIVVLLALTLSFIAASSLALLTVRDLQTGVSEIESGLTALQKDLNNVVHTPNTAELRRIAGAINQLAESLRLTIEQRTKLEAELRRSERLSALGRVVTGVAHEVRNPLAAIKLKVQLAQRNPGSDQKVSETFDVVRTEIERLDKLVRRLLDLGGQQELKRAPVDLRELVCERVLLFMDLANRSRTTISTDELQTDMVIDGDHDRLAQVVDNLIQNALEAMSNGGELTISSDVIKGDAAMNVVRLTFNDTGRGIAEPQRQHIFEPFYTGRADGTGLGLAIARGIVKEHSGEISFTSRAGVGTSFVISLPVTKIESIDSLNRQ